jgi:hypothetical protein
MQEEMAKEKEIYQLEEAAYLQAIEAKQGFQKSLREKQAQHAEAEKAARQQREKEQIEKERKKLTRFKEERNKMRNDILFAKRDEIVKEKKEKERQIQNDRATMERNIDLRAAAKAEAKAAFNQEQKARKDRDMMEKKGTIEKIKQESEMARRQLIDQKQAWMDSVRRGSDYSCRSPTSPMFPHVRGAFGSTIGSQTSR